MPEVDSVTLAKIDSEGLTYTFNKGGKYTYSGAFSGGGTFEINDEGTTMSTVEEGTISMYTVMLTEGSLNLSSPKESMTFTANK